MTELFAVRGEDGRSLSRSLLETAVRLCWGWTELPKLECSTRGKPEFADKPGYWMSLSHSGGYALCALSDEGPVGVDFEIVRSHREGLPRYSMNDTEWESFDGSWEEFTRVWTLKEAWCKREDIPLFPPRNVITPPPCSHRSYSGEDWRAALCCTGKPPAEIKWLENL